MHLQSSLDTNFNKDTHSTVLYFLVYDEDKEKQNDLGGFQKNEVFFNIKAELISFIHIRSHLYLKCVL